MKLENAAVILTGASRGIGASLALALAARGARLVLVARDAKKLEAVATEVTSRGGQARVVAGDVAVPETATRAVAVAREAFSGVDLLINNAAILIPPRPVVETPLDEFRSVLDVNVMGTVSFLKAALPVMAERGSGVAVNLSSGWGRSADAGVASYCASKFAVEGLTQAVACEVPKGLCVVAVNPGIIDTDMLRTAWAQGAAAYPGPDDLAPRFLRMLDKLGPSWNGRSLDAMEF
jgi:NAD(P)-dependent dehydrogenase (short-subunit alcohol dehydrogenase family)